MKTYPRINPFLVLSMYSDAELFCPGHTSVQEVNENSPFTKQPRNVYCILSQKEGWVFIGTFYVLELLYSDLGPWISWSCWAFSLPSSNLGLMFDSHLIFIFFMDGSVLCFSVKSGDWNKQIFTKCLLCTKVFSFKKREYFKSIQNV